jgi:hypothetical protein
VEVEVALTDPAAAFEQYLQKYAVTTAPKGHPQPGGPQDSKSKADRLEIFTKNLQKVAARNTASGSQLLAFGITPFLHLTQSEFEQNYLGMTEAAAAAEVQYEVSWTADDYDAAAPNSTTSRKLLARTQAPAVPALDDTASLSSLDASAHLRTSSSTSSSNDGAMELAEAPTAAGAVPPAQHLPWSLHEAPATGPSNGMPTLPFNPEPGSSGCMAQRSYPWDDVVPPAEGVNWWVRLAEQSLKGSPSSITNATSSNRCHRPFTPCCQSRECLQQLQATAAVSAV